MDLVTGATGIVGMPLVVKLLAKGQTVRALHRPSSHRDRVEQAVRDSVPDGLSRLQWVEGDVTDPDSLEAALEGVERVFHCAALVSFHKADHAAMRAINAEGTANLVNAMLDLGTPRLIHVSSVAALGRKAGQPTDESTLFEEQPGTSGYARSKHRAEMEAWRGAAEGLPGGLVVVNPTVILGPGDFRRSSAALFRHIDQGLAWYPSGSGGYVGSEDVAEVCVRLGD
ncbi:MAG: NAD-dependent epimerase/dehydratase family protein, partial [Bacteroidetes bacterium]|nr:NAD-dependent epimerase/dehydratase family protein [Bacteroidota bacterium]